MNIGIRQKLQLSTIEGKQISWNRINKLTKDGTIDKQLR